MQRPFFSLPTQPAPHRSFPSARCSRDAPTSATLDTDARPCLPTEPLLTPSTDTCAICRNKLYEPSIEAQASAQSFHARAYSRVCTQTHSRAPLLTYACPDSLARTDPGVADDAGYSIAWGCCGHVFHLDCISRWLKTRSVCPLCNREWECAADCRHPPTNRAPPSRHHASTHSPYHPAPHASAHAAPHASAHALSPPSSCVPPLPTGLQRSRRSPRTETSTDASLFICWARLCDANADVGDAGHLRASVRQCVKGCDPCVLRAAPRWLVRGADEGSYLRETRREAAISRSPMIRCSGVDTIPYVGPTQRPGYVIDCANGIRRMPMEMRCHSNGSVEESAVPSHSTCLVCTVTLPPRRP
jgi:hypothetical protein